MVVAGLSSFNERIAQSVAFMEWGFNAWKSVPLAKKGARLQTAEVQLGDKREVALIAPRDLAVTLPRASRNSEIKVSVAYNGPIKAPIARRSEEHTSELQSLMRISYAVFCLKKKKKNTQQDRRNAYATYNE